MRIVYLHGFASSPQSSKARFFARRFAEAGVEFSAPQLDGGDFEQLTITSQLNVIERAVGAGPAVLMGSSLGGYLAALFAARHPERVERLVLLAPAFGFYERFRARLTAAQLAEWKQKHRIMVFHYGSKTEQPLGFSLLEDAVAYEPVPDFRQAVLILHGIQDDVVPLAGSQAFVNTHPNAKLHTVASAHELTDVVDELWRETARFLQIVYPSLGC